VLTSKEIPFRADTQKVAIRTVNGFYVTAINGGGMGEDANALPIHTDASVVQDWEIFSVYFNDDGTCLISTSAPYWLTAVNGGRIAAPPNSPVATDRDEIGPWETFSLEEQSRGVYAFRTPNGDYLTAVNAGGMATEGAPLHTDQTEPTANGLFILVPVRDDPARREEKLIGRKSGKRTTEI
jgi:hypothetical protein